MKFSVLIPVYIKEKPIHFLEALESIVQQTLMPDEIVIVEDGPITPELHKILEIYINRYPGLFTIIQLKKNSGMGVAMNTGLHACKYEYIARMDSDDIAKKDRFEKQFSFLKKHPEIDVLGGNIEEFKYEPNDLKRVRQLPEHHSAIVEFTKQRSPVNHMTVVFKRSKAIAAGGYWSHRNLEDYNLWYEMLKIGCTFHNLPDILMDVRIGNNMAKRRHGYNYFTCEYSFFKKMLHEDFIDKELFFRNVFIRFFLRVLPLPFLQITYGLFLRKAK